MKIEQMIEQHKQMWAAFEKLNEKLEQKQAPYVPKDGEYFYVLSTLGKAFIGIKKMGRQITSRYVSCFKSLERLYMDDSYCVCDDNIANIRPATPEEKQLLDSKLKEQGKRWNAEKKCIEDIPTWSVGDWFIPHKPKGETSCPTWVSRMNAFDGVTLKVEDINWRGSLVSGKWEYNPDWCEKTEEPKKEPKIGDMCIFWDNKKEYAVCALYGGAKHDYFMDTTGTMWQNCIPFESVEQYKKFINEEC